MSDIFFNITATVLVLNVLFLLIPDGKYGKYVQFVAGLIVILTVAGNFINVSLEYTALEFDKESFSKFDEDAFKNSVRKDLIEDSIEVKITDTLNIETDVIVETDNNDILSVTVLSDSLKNEEIIDVVSRYCDINRNFIVVK